MQLDKYYVGVKNGDEVEKREVVKIDFGNSQFTVLAKDEGRPDEVYVASQVVPMDKRGRERLSFMYNLQKGLNIYKQPLINALRSTDEVIEAYEKAEESASVVSPTTYRKAKAVKQQLLKEMFEVTQAYAVDIVDAAGEENIRELKESQQLEADKLIEAVRKDMYSEVRSEVEAEMEKKYKHLSHKYANSQPEVSNRFNPVAGLMAIIRTLLK